MIVKNCGVLGTPLKQCHEAKGHQPQCLVKCQRKTIYVEVQLVKAPNDIGTSPFPSIPHQLSLRWIKVICMRRYLNGVTIK
jgi:hypothetical protein